MQHCALCLSCFLLRQSCQWEWHVTRCSWVHVPAPSPPPTLPQLFAAVNWRNKGLAFASIWGIPTSRGLLTLPMPGRLLPPVAPHSPLARLLSVFLCSSLSVQLLGFIIWVSYMCFCVIYFVLFGIKWDSSLPVPQFGVVVLQYCVALVSCKRNWSCTKIWSFNECSLVIIFRHTGALGFYSVHYPNNLSSLPKIVPVRLNYN